MDIGVGLAVLSAKVGTALSIVWSAEGVSEFASAVGGAAIVHFLTVRRDRKAQEELRKDVLSATMWSIYFKAKHCLEVVGDAHAVISGARKRADENGENLWQTLQFSIGDPELENIDHRELMVFVEAREFGLLEDFREAHRSTRALLSAASYYREARIKFLEGQEHDMGEDGGLMRVHEANLPMLAYPIASLEGLATSIEKGVGEKMQGVEKLVDQISQMMQGQIGMRPELAVSQPILTPRED